MQPILGNTPFCFFYFDNLRIGVAHAEAAKFLDNIVVWSDANTHICISISVYIYIYIYLHADT